MALRRRFAGVFGLSTLLLAAAVQAAPQAPVRRAPETPRAPQAAPPSVGDLVAGALAGGSVDAAVAALLDKASAEPARADEIAAGLLLLDRNDAALDVLQAAGRNAETFEMLVGALRIDEALALPVSDTDAAGLLARARTLAAIGRRDEAMATLAKVAATRDASRPGVATLAVREAGALGMSSEAMAGALGLVAGAPAARSREMIAALWPARRAEADAAWTWLARQTPAPAADEMLIRIRGILDASQPSQDADQLLREGAGLVAGLTTCEQSHVASGLVGLAQMRKQSDAALAIARAWADGSGSPQAWATVGDLLSDREQWTAAAAAYGKAADLQPAEGATRWLQAAMLRKAGDAAGADALAARAEASATQACSQLRLAFAMDLAGDRTDASRVRRDVIAAAEPTSAVVAAAAAQIGRRTVDAGAADAVIAAFDDARARAARGTLTVATFLPLVRNAQSAELGAMAAKGDVDGALALAAHAVEPFLTNLDATADVVNALRSAGRETEADALLTQASEAYAGVGDAGAHYLNARAWLAARTRTNLDAGLAAAERAVELAPTNSGILDTLAEVRFQMGDRAGALEAEQRALTLTPDREYLQAQIRRFTSGDPATAPPLGLE